MPYIFNLLYLVAVFLLSPFLLYKSLTTGKYRRGMWRKFTGRTPIISDARPCVWFHGVSVGEIHLLRQVVGAFRVRHPDWNCVISTTTDTGFDEARRRFPDLTVVFWPLDFSWAVRRAIRAIRPNLVVLAEGEIWPNFLLAARKAGVPVAVINGRMSPRSVRHYRWFGGLVRHLLGMIDLLAMQTTEYADNMRALGAPAKRVRVTGPVKYDGVEMDRRNPRTETLRELLNIKPDELVWIAGSTQAPEEGIVLEIFRRLRVSRLRLLIVPRQKDRFEEVATLLSRSGLPFVMRSELSNPGEKVPDIVLVDTIGELGALWGLADVAFVGGSLDGKRGGQNMIEPAAYGAAVVFGPHVWNFRDTAARLVKAGAALQIQDAAALETAVRQFLDDADLRQRLGQAAQELVRSQQGATERTIHWLDELIGRREVASRAA